MKGVNHRVWSKCIRCVGDEFPNSLTNQPVLVHLFNIIQIWKIYFDSKSNRFILVGHMSMCWNCMKLFPYDIGGGGWGVITFVGIKIRAEKNHLIRYEVEYLGYQVSAEGNQVM